jgi:hypothetical protein
MEQLEIEDPLGVLATIKTRLVGRKLLISARERRRKYHRKPDATCSLVVWVPDLLRQIGILRDVLFATALAISFSVRCD